MPPRGDLLRAAILLALALWGCDWPFESDDYRNRLAGVWEVTAPDTVDVGSIFEVVMMSSGTNGCWKAGRDDVRRTGPLAATITPYDQEFVGTGACTANVPNFRHSVRLPTSTRGDFTVRVRTLKRASSGKDSVGVIQRTVVVR
jgi:hypothetical protein